MSDEIRQKKWHQYYSEKRIVHQWMQVHLLENLKVSRVLEIGPYLGLVSAMIRNAGYEVSSFDIVEEADITGDVRNLDVSEIKNYDFDLVICCETLEHLPFNEVGTVLHKISETGIKYLILSVPFSGNQFGFSIYWNKYFFKKQTLLKKFMGSKHFPAPAPDSADLQDHHWEIGYRNMPLTRWQGKVEENFRVLRTEFTSGCRSVFFLCENKNRETDLDA